MPSSHHVAKAVLDRETDARFWAQTGYKPGRKLDLSDPIDRSMAKVWVDIFAKVQREDAEGRLVLTYNHPVVEEHLAAASIAAHAADAHLDAAVAEDDPGVRQQHVEAASDAARRAGASTREAASQQPPSVSPVVADAAAQDAARRAGIAPPAPVVAELPPDHPASSDAARPVVGPEATADPAAAAAPSVPGAPPLRPSAVAQALAAPSVAVQSHQDAATRTDGPRGTLPAATIADVRAMAASMAARSPAQFLGANLDPDGSWSLPEFRSADEAASWYGHLTDSPDAFRYLAYYDKTDRSWPGPVNEVFGSGRAIGVTVHVDRPAPRATVKTRTNYGPIAAVGAFSLASFITIFAGRRRRRANNGGY